MRNDSTAYKKHIRDKEYNKHIYMPATVNIGHKVSLCWLAESLPALYERSCIARLTFLLKGCA